MSNYEIDFICRKGEDKCYVQVEYLLADEKIEKREFRPLLEIRNNFPKIHYNNGFYRYVKRRYNSAL